MNSSSSGTLRDMTNVTLTGVQSTIDVERLRRRFEAKVDRTPGLGPAGECHLWRGTVGDAGYGQIKVCGRTENAPRVALFLATGEWPPADRLALHAPVICHTKTCVNVAHLRPGTHAENSADRVADGTAREIQCANGHPRAGNLSTAPDGRWCCRVCGADEWKRAWPSGRRARRSTLEVPS